MTNIAISILILLVICFVYFLFRFITGDFSYDEKEYGKNIYDITKMNDYGVHTIVGEEHRIVIKRTYHSGRIKFINKVIRF